MKNFKFTVILLCLIIAVSFSACGKPEIEETVAPEIIAIAGDYMLDVADYGMPIIIYINIDSEGNFKLSSDLEYSVNKGNGKVSYKDGTFMFIFSDSTVDTPKTATFTVVNSNLVFSTRLPYGTGGIDSSDVTNPVTAKTMKDSEILGRYYGGHTTTGMMAVDYTYYIELRAGCEYTIRSDFSLAMGGPATDYYFIEKGTYEYSGTVITLHPIETTNNIDNKTSAYEGDAIVGTFIDGVISVSIQPSSMATSRYDATLTFAPMSEYAATYRGYYSKNMMGTQLTVVGTLVLDPFGGYTFSIEDLIGEGAYTESGTYTVNGTAYTINPTNVNGIDTVLDPVECVVENHTFAGKFPVSSEAATMRGSFVFYDSLVLGNFSYSDEECSATLNVDIIGLAYNLVIKDASETVVFESSGAISTSAGGMGMVYLVLTDGTTSDVYQLLISEAGLQGNIEVGSETYGIALK